jgi:hypothetical protein
MGRKIVSPGVGIEILFCEKEPKYDPAYYGVPMNLASEIRKIKGRYSYTEENDTMSTHYAKRMVGWKKWMKEYQYGIVLILPPEPHRTVVNAFRQAYPWS